MDKCSRPAMKDDEIFDCSGALMPIGNSRWIPDVSGLPGSAMAGKPAPRTGRTGAPTYRNRAGNVELPVTDGEGGGQPSTAREAT